MEGFVTLDEVGGDDSKLQNPNINLVTKIMMYWLKLGGQDGGT